MKTEYPNLFKAPTHKMKKWKYLTLVKWHETYVEAANAVELSKRRYKARLLDRVKE